MPFLFLFLDGVGLGADDPEINPLARAEMPHLQGLLEGRRLVASAASFEGPHASLVALDACLGVGGLPQSASGQATLLTGINVPATLGYHYGPKPDPPIAACLRNGNLFRTLCEAGRQAVFLNAYPPRYFEAISAGRRLFSAIPLAVSAAGLPLKTSADLQAGQALSADFTGQGWRDHLGFSTAPVLEPTQAGERLASLGLAHDFAFFEYWLSDYVGHKQRFTDALRLLEEFDAVLGGLLRAWDDRRGLIFITSDHGNLEDLSTRRHTLNPVPGLLIGAREMRRDFTAGLRDLCGVTPAILKHFDFPQRGKQGERPLPDHPDGQPGHQPER